MNAKLNFFIGALILSLIGTSTYAIRSSMESPKTRADRINLTNLQKCLNDAREISILKDALEATRHCPKIEMIQVIEPPTTGTVTPASSGVPGGYSSFNSYSINTSNELERTLLSASGEAPVSSDEVYGAHKAHGEKLAETEANSSGGTRGPTQDGSEHGKDIAKGAGKKISEESIEILRESGNLNLLEVLNLDSCRKVQDEDSHVTQARGHVYATDIACERGKSFTVSAPQWKKEYKVIAVGQDKRIGNYIVLEHKSYRFVFGHTVTPHKVGDKVLAGTQIGYTDDSGVAENVHLHFELWRDGYNITHEEMLGKGSRWNDDYSFRLLLQRGWYTGVDDAVDFITTFEGFRDTSYEDPKGSGRWSIGYGTFADGPNEKITKEQAKIRIRSKVIENMEFIYRKRLALSWSERIALSSFFYNLGTARPEMVEALKKRDMKGIKSLWMQYVNPGSIYEKGLKKRREQEWSKFISK